jgi:hypothetical protein
MNIKMVDQQGKEIVQTPDKVSETITMKLDEFLPQSVGQLFDLSPNEVNSYSNKIGTLIDYAKSQTGDHSPEGIKWALRALQGRVGTPPLGEKWINYLSKYAWLKLDELRLKGEIEQYDHNG